MDDREVDTMSERERDELEFQLMYEEDMKDIDVSKALHICLTDTSRRNMMIKSLHKQNQMDWLQEPFKQLG